MNSDELLSILNRAGKDELIALPGIGPALADRILAARPFASLAAAQEVKGMRKTLFDDLLDNPPPRPDIRPSRASQEVKEVSAVSQVEDIKETLVEKGKAAQKVIGKGISEISDNLREGVSELGETISKGSQAAYKAVEALPEKFEQASKERGPLWTIMVSCACTALVTIVLTLLILASINGSLKFATGAQYRTLQTEVSSLTEQVNTMQQDLDGLRTRVNTLEGLGERTVALEKNQQQLSADMKNASQQVIAMQSEVTALAKKVTQQEERTQRFDTFLKDLQTLLSNLLIPQGVTE